jgi:LPXTG-site transpeptidase (sortase) family protein
VTSAPAASEAPLAPDKTTERPERSPAVSGAPQRGRSVSTETLVRRGIGSAFLILAACLLSFVVWVAFLSQLHYARAQHNAYDALRISLAQGTTPVGPTQLVNPNVENSPTVPVPLGTPLALLSIPKIRLNAVVLQGTTGSVLENGPGHLRDTQMPGQFGTSVIMGRRAAYGGPFAKLSTLNPGDTFTVVTGQTEAQFRVLDLRRGGDASPPPPATGQSRLILVTADGTPFAPTGILYVDADLTSKPQPAPPMTLSVANLPASEQAMGTEPQAWLPIVFWGQLMLLITLGLSWGWSAWGKWQAWVIAIPALGYLVFTVSDQVTRLLPNLT